MPTENGAMSHASTLDHRLNLFFKTTRDMGVMDRPYTSPPFDFHPYQYEGATEDDNETCDEAPFVHVDNTQLFNLIDKSWSVSPLDTMKILMNWRDCRGGKGDHRGFIVAMSYLADKHPNWVETNIHIIPEYGCYLDLVKLWHFAPPRIKDCILKMIVSKLKHDKSLLGSLTDKTAISLLAKWIPSENSKWDRYTKDRFIIALCRELFGVFNVTSGHIKTLRKSYLTPLRNHLKLVETRLCTREYESLDYSAVPSVAMNKYKKAFTRNDFSKFSEFLTDVSNNKTKINASQVYPHNLVRAYLNETSPISEQPVIEAQWRVLKEKCQATRAFDDSIVVCDVSGSMTGTPIEVAIALSLLSLNPNANNNRVITFSANPTLYHIPDGSLFDQVQRIKDMHWGMNTDFAKVMTLVLGMCSAQAQSSLQAQPSQTKQIKRVFVFSDMQFDEAFDNTSTHFDQMKKSFAAASIPFPQIVFWNLRGSCFPGTSNIHVTCDERGVTLLSGYSPSLLTSLLDGDTITPLDVLMKIINSPRYHLIKAPE